jgi:hypothetical protein
MNPTVADHHTRNRLIPRRPARELPTVTAEVASSSLVVPAIYSKRVERISLRLVAENLFLRKQLTLLSSAPARRKEHCRRREELCVRKLGSHMEAIEPAFSFPTAVATVERQEILVVEMHLDFVKVWLKIDGFAETKVVRLGASFFRKPR